MEPLHCHGLSICRRPPHIVDCPVISELALQLLGVVLDLVEEFWLVMLLPDSHLLPDVAQETELLHGLVAVEGRRPPAQLLADLLLRWRR